jgi:hypothetical protein
MVVITNEIGSNQIQHNSEKACWDAEKIRFKHATILITLLEFIICSLKIVISAVTSRIEHASAGFVHVAAVSVDELTFNCSFSPRSFRRDDERYFGPSEDFTSFHASFPSKELEMTLVNDMRLSTAFREVFTNFSSKKNLSVTPQKVGKDEGVAKKNKIAAALFVMESEDSK